MLDAVLDISHHQNVDSFWQIKKSGVIGLIHKATQGGAMVDPDFHRHIQRAREALLLLGAYHFGTSADAYKQADHFLRVVSQFALPASMLCVLDWESNKDATMTLEGAELFVETVYAKTKRYPVIYSGMSFFNDRVRGRKPSSTVLGRCPLWIARYAEVPPALPKGWGPWSLWQYTDLGQTAGIVGNVDRNRFKGTDEQLRKWWMDAGR